MRAAIIIALREMGGWLLTPGSYVGAALLLAAAGADFWMNATSPSSWTALLPEVLLGSAFFWALFGMAAAVIGARLMAGERENGSLDLLLSAPLQPWQLVAGKYLGGLAWLLLVAWCAWVAPWLLTRVMGPEFMMDSGAVLTGALLMVFAGGLAMAAGLLVSSLCGRQTVAALATLGLLAGVAWLGGRVAAFERVVAMLTGLTIPAAKEAWAGMARGVMDSRVAVLSVTGSVWLLYACTRVVEWRQQGGGWMAAIRRVVNTALLAVLLLAVCQVALRHPLRADWTAARAHTLDVRSQEILRRLDQPVRLVMLAQARHPFSEPLRRLLNLYRDASPHIEVEEVDPDRDLTRAKDAARRYGLTSGNVVVVETPERRLVIPMAELIGKIERGTDDSGLSDRTFRGEAALSSAIHRAAQAAPPRVCFLRGHGERSPEDRRPLAGYAEAVRRLRLDGMEIIEQFANEMRMYSNDYTVVVAGPRERLSQEALQVMRERLNRGGGAVVLLDPGVDTGLEPLLAEWGVQIQADRVVEGGPGGTAVPGAVWRPIRVSRYGRHPITRPLTGLTTAFPLPRSVSAIEWAGPDRADRPRVTILAYSSSSAWAESDPDQHPPQFDEGYDRPGPISLAAAAERGRPERVDVGIRPTRLVVIGDSQFAANGALAGGNEAFFVESVRWAAQQEYLMEIPSGPARAFKRPAEARGRMAALVTAGTAPLAMLVLAAATAAVRRDRRRSKALPRGADPRDGDAP